MDDTMNNQTSNVEAFSIFTKNIIFTKFFTKIILYHFQNCLTMKRTVILFSFLLFLVGESMGQCTPEDCSAILPPYGGVCDTVLMTGYVNQPYSDFESFVITDECFDAGLIDPAQEGQVIRITNVDQFAFSLLPAGLEGATNAQSYSPPGGGITVGCASVDGTPTQAGTFEFSIDFLADVSLCGIFPLPLADNPANYLVDLVIKPDASFTGLGSTYCSDDTAVTLTPNANYPNGTFFGPGVNGGMFDPAVAGPGTHSISYTVSAQEGAAIAPAADTMSMNVVVEDCTLPCDVPTGLGFDVLSDTEVTLWWDAVTTGAPVSFYKLRYRVNGTSTWTYQQVTNNSVTLTDLTPGAYYEFRVQSNCSGVLSAASVFKRWTMTVCQSPLYSSIVSTPDPCAPRNMLVSWTPPENASVDRYKILYRDPSMPAGTWNAKYTPSDGGATTEKLLSQLELDTWYKVRVKTWCTGGEKSFLYSGYGEFTTLADNSGCRMGLTMDGVNVFPNPASDVLNVSYEVLDEATDVNISIMDMTGRTIQTVERAGVVGNQRETINIDGMGAGYYFVSIRSNGETITKKFAIVE
jgi:hypothetical protein